MENKMKFKKGQKAWSSQFGWGVIRTINETYTFPIEFIAKANGLVVTYLLDGREFESAILPTLFHKEQVFDYSEPEIPIGTFGYFWEDSYNYRAVLGYYRGLTEFGKHECRGHLSFDNFCAYPELPPHLKENP